MNPVFLSRDEYGDVKNAFDYVEGISFKENPFEFLLLLARYKFAARLIDKESHVLDAGCGLGIGSVLLSKFAKKVTAIDFDKDLLKSNKEQYKGISNIDFQHLDLVNLPDHHPVYNTVVSMDVIEHFPLVQSEQVIKNISKMTEDNGFAVIGTPNIASQKFASSKRLQSHLHEFEPDELKNLLKKYFSQVFLFSMTDEVVSLSFNKMAWYLMTICIK